MIYLTKFTTDYFLIILLQVCRLGTLFWNCFTNRFDLFIVNFKLRFFLIKTIYEGCLFTLWYLHTLFIWNRRKYPWYLYRF